MDNDQKKLTLEEYFESANIAANAEKFDVSGFISGLDAYGAVPDDVAGIVIGLYTSEPEQRASLIKQLYTELQARPGAIEAPNLPQLSTSSEVQSAIPIATISEGRKQAHRDTGEYILHQHGVKTSGLKTVEENIKWRRDVTQQFFAKLQEERLYGSIGAQEAEAKKAIENALQEPIYETNRKKIEKIIAERISNQEVFRQKQKEFQAFFEETASIESVSYAPLSDEVTIAAVGAVLENRTLEDVRPVLNTFASVSMVEGRPSNEELSFAIKKANIYGSVSAGTPTDQKIETSVAQGFNTNIRSVQQNQTHKQKVLEKVAVDDYGRSLVENGQADEFIRRSEKYSSNSLKNKVTGYVSPAYTPDSETLEYLAAEIRHNATGFATAEGLQQAKTHANASHPTHFEFHLPEASWFIRPGAKKPGLTVAETVLKKGASLTARELGTQALIKLGFGATSKMVLVGAPVVGWAILIWTTFSGTIKNITNATVGNIINGGLGSIRSANGAFGEFVQNAVQTKYEDPWAANATNLAVLAAVAPVILTFGFVVQTIGTQRAQFTPIGYGKNYGSTVPIIDCSKTPDNPMCKMEPCIPKGPNDCKWPTTGYITQGPLAHCTIGGERESSHDTMSAIDIGAGYGTDVISVKPGTVSKWASGCADQPSGRSSSWGCNGGWGNHIDISSPDGYTLRYAHLSLQTMGIVSLGATVTLGQVIGKVDNTGNSTGNHLHFGVQSGPGNIFSVIPLTPQEADAVNGCVGTRPGCPKVCPIIQTTVN